MFFFKTWKDVMLKPSDFYRNMSTTGGYAEPLTFAGINFVIIGTLYALILSPVLGLMELDMKGYFVLIIFVAAFGFIIHLIGCLILHNIYKFLEGNGTFQGTVRFASYATAVTILITSIPIIGWLLTLYFAYLNIVGGMIVHNVSMGKSVLAAVIYCSVAFVLILILTSILSSLFFTILRNSM